MSTWLDRMFEQHEGPIKICMHPSHNFPSMLYIPPGHKVTHVCPGCGASITVYGRAIYL